MGNLATGGEIKTKKRTALTVLLFVSELLPIGCSEGRHGCVPEAAPAPLPLSSSQLLKAPPACRLWRKGEKGGQTTAKRQPLDSYLRLARGAVTSLHPVVRCGWVRCFLSPSAAASLLLLVFRCVLCLQTIGGSELSQLVSCFYSAPKPPCSYSREPPPRPAREKGRRRGGREKVGGNS